MGAHKFLAMSTMALFFCSDDAYKFLAMSSLGTLAVCELGSSPARRKATPADRG